MMATYVNVEKYGGGERIVQACVKHDRGKKY